MKSQSEEQDLNKALEPILVILMAILRSNPQYKLEDTTKERIVKALARAGYSQNNIASMVGSSATDINRILKK